MCFRSAAEGQKALIEKGCEAQHPLQRGNKAWMAEEPRPARVREKGQDWWGRVWAVLDLDLNLNGRSEVRVDKVQAQSPTITRGAKSWRSSAAETGPPVGWLPRCLRLASLELEGGKSLIEEPVAVTTNGTSCCCWSSMPSCSASCLFTAMALSAKNVRSLVLLDLMDKIRDKYSWIKVNL